jgi:hypothetical protein
MITLGCFLLGALLPVEGPSDAEWDHARCILEPLPDGAMIIYDFTGNVTSCWARRVYAEARDLTAHQYLTFTVHGEGTGLRLSTHIIRHENGKEQAFASPAIELDYAETRSFSVPLRAMVHSGRLISDEELRDIDQVNFGLNRVASGRGRLSVTDIAFSDAPRGEVLEPSLSKAAFASDEDFLAAIDWPAGVERSVEGFGTHLARRGKPRFFFDGQDPAKLLAVLRARFPGVLRAKRRDADEHVLPRRFVFEGDARQLSDPIQWHQGPVEWTNILNRLQYLESLWVTYWDTGDDQYAEDCVGLLNDWIDNNRPPDLVGNEGYPEGNPWRSLEVGVRCDTVARAFYALAGSPSLSSTMRAKIARSLAEHARYLVAMEKRTGYSGGNWQVVECAGLATVGMLFPEFKEATEWRETGLHWLYEHMKRDVYDDGVHHEVTPGYHGWVTERFTTVLQLARLNGYALDEGFTRKLERMYDFDLKIASPSGHTPMNGDCGRASLRGRLATGALLYDDPHMRYLGDPAPSLDAVWLLGPGAVERYDAMAKTPPSFTSVLLPDSGYCIMRTGWGPDDLWFFFDLVPYGGGHSHPDQLSFDFQAGPTLVISDSGRANYNHPLHAGYFRTPEAHNTCSVDGRFADPQKSPKRLEWQVGARYAVARGSIPIGDVLWERGVLWVKPDLWVVRDLFKGTGLHRVVRRVHFAASYPENPELPFPFTDCVRIDDGQVRAEDGWFGISASTRYEAPTLAAASEIQLPGVLWMLVSPDSALLKAVSVRSNVEDFALTVPGAWEVHWRWPDGEGPSDVVWTRVGDAS